MVDVKKIIEAILILIVTIVIYIALKEELGVSIFGL